MQKEILQWHPAVFAAFEIDIPEDMKLLYCEAEHGLSKKPLMIDMLLIRRDREGSFQSSLCQLFRKYNIVEYKNPDESFSINDFYKVIAYACLYQSDTKHVMDIDPREITLTVLVNHFPRELIKYLALAYGAKPERFSQGIYYIRGLLFPMQVVIIHELSTKEYRWLGSLRKDLDEEKDLKPLFEEYRREENKNPLYSVLMELIVYANRNEQGGKEKMCNAVQELIDEMLAEWEKKGEARGIQIGERREKERFLRNCYLHGVSVEQAAVLSGMEVKDVSGFFRESMQTQAR